MRVALLIPLIAVVIGAMLAAAVLVRDPGQRANRLLAAILVAASWWSLCEVVSGFQADADAAVRVIRLSALGWLWFGPLAIELVVELAGTNLHARVRRWIQASWGLSGVCAVLYAATPWGLAEGIPTGWGGYSFRFGPLFPVPYALTVGQVGLALVSWPRVFSGVGAVERRHAAWLFVGFSVPVLVASITDVLLPAVGFHVPRMGSVSLLVMSGVAALNVRQHGHLRIAPGAFPHEIVDALRDGMALVRTDGTIRTCNEAFARLARRPAKELEGAPIAELIPGLLALGARRLAGVEADLVTGEAEAIPVSVSWSPLVDRRGRAVGRVLVVRDRRDVALLRSRLVDTGRMAAVGELAAGIAHQISRPIDAARSGLVELRRHWELLAEASARDPQGPELDALVREAEELIDESIEGVDRVASIVKDVGAFSDTEHGRSQTANVNDLLDNALGVAVLSFPASVERCYGDVPPVSGDPQQLKQAFLNLVLNAIQAVDGAGRIRLVTQRSGGFVVVRVQDDGPGIPPEHIERVFDPFFTTRPAGAGLGLGLAHAHHIVRRHGGEIRVTSQPGAGTVFEVRLPAAGDAARGRAAA
jgi:signal transduction histidine kinase